MYRVELGGKSKKLSKIGFGDIKAVKFMETAAHKDKDATADSRLQNILLLRDNGDLLSLRQVAWKANLGLFQKGSIYKTYFDIISFMIYVMLNVIGFCCIKYPADWQVHVHT